MSTKVNYTTYYKKEETKLVTMLWLCFHLLLTMILTFVILILKFVSGKSIIVEILFFASLAITTYRVWYFIKNTVSVCTLFGRYILYTKGVSVDFINYNGVRVELVPILNSYIADEIKEQLFNLDITGLKDLGVFTNIMLLKTTILALDSAGLHNSLYYFRLSEATFFIDLVNAERGNVAPDSKQ